MALRSFRIPLYFPIATQLLAGTLSDTSVPVVAHAIQAETLVTAKTYLVILFCSYSIGSFVRRLVWTCRWDTYFLFLRMKHSWFYVLQGRLPQLPRRVVPYVDVLTKHPGQSAEESRLYRGVVVDFELSSTGGLDSLTLIDSKRGRGRGDKFEWVDIPSSRLIIIGSTIHSINLTYVEIAEPQPGSRRARLYLALRNSWRRFILEEP